MKDEGSSIQKGFDLVADQIFELFSAINQLRARDEYLLTRLNKLDGRMCDKFILDIEGVINGDKEEKI